MATKMKSLMIHKPAAVGKMLNSWLKVCFWKLNQVNLHLKFYFKVKIKLIVKKKEKEIEQIIN